MLSLSLCAALSDIPVAVMSSMMFCIDRYMRYCDAIAVGLTFDDYYHDQLDIGDSHVRLDMHRSRMYCKLPSKQRFDVVVVFVLAAVSAVVVAESVGD